MEWLKQDLTSLFMLAIPLTLQDFLIAEFASSRLNKELSYSISEAVRLTLSYLDRCSVSRFSYSSVVINHTSTLAGGSALIL